MILPLTQLHTFWFKSLTGPPKLFTPSEKVVEVQLGSEYVSTCLFPGACYILLRKKVMQEKQMGELRNAFLQMFCETSSNKLLLLSKKSLHNVLK